MIDLLSWATCNTIHIYPHICIPLYLCFIPHLVNFYTRFEANTILMNTIFSLYSVQCTCEDAEASRATSKDHVTNGTR